MSRNTLIWTIIFVILIVAGIAGAMYLYRQGSSPSESTVDLTEITTAPEVEEPTPTPDEVNLTAHEIVIQNGSGVAGAASRLQTALEDAGFVVASVGNADASDYEETIIRRKSSVSDQFVDALQDELEKTYIVGDVENLDEDEDADLIIIIGSSRVDGAEEVTPAQPTATTAPAVSPTATPTPTSSQT